MKALDLVQWKRVGRYMQYFLGLLNEFEESIPPLEINDALRELYHVRGVLQPYLLRKINVRDYAYVLNVVGYREGLEGLGVDLVPFWRDHYGVTLQTPERVIEVKYHAWGQVYHFPLEVFEGFLRTLDTSSRATRDYDFNSKIENFMVRFYQISNPDLPPEDIIISFTPRLLLTSPAQRVIIQAYLNSVWREPELGEETSVCPLCGTYLIRFKVRKAISFQDYSRSYGDSTQCPQCLNIF